MIIIPSILTSDPQELEELMERVEGVVDRVQIDIIDGVYANNKTIDPPALNELDTALKIDYQLMTKEPINWVEKCTRGQADRIIGHIEMMSSQVEFVKKVQEVGKEVGLGLDIETSIESLDSSVLTDLDVVLLMSVPSGFGGQKFDRRVLGKISSLAEIRKSDKTPFVIHDDGGVTLEYIDDVGEEGADEVSIGRKLFDGDLKANIDKYLKAASK